MDRRRFARWPGGEAAHSIALACGRLSFLHAAGARRLVLLLHGNSSCGQIFAHQASALRAAGYGVLAPDLPGHGASDDAAEPERTYSFPGYAAAVGALLDALNVEEVACLGWSLGGHVALELLARDRRVKAVLVTGAPPVRPSPEALDEAFRPTPTMLLAGKAAFTEAQARAYAAAMLGGRRFVTPLLLAAARRTDGRARLLMLQSALAGRGADAAALVRNDPTPLAIVQGAQDPFLNGAYLDRLACANLWRGAVQWLDGLGHAPHWQAPQRFDGYLLSFLEEMS